MDQIKRRDFVGQLAGIAGMVGMGSALAIVPEAASAQGHGHGSDDSLAVPVTGAITQTATNTTTPVAGTLTVNHFASQAGNIVASGIATVSGAGGAVTTIPFSNLPVIILPTSTCDVLNLTLGPLDLNLLGLQIHLDQIHLSIVANPAGGILGQILCSLAGGGPLGQLVSLLNRLLGLL